MDTEIVKKWDENKERLRKLLANGHPNGYRHLLRILVDTIFDEDDYCDSDTPWQGITIKDVEYGSWQGRIVFILGDEYSPMWALSVNYGSCSVCDTFQSVRYGHYDAPDYDGDYDYDGEPPPNERQIAGYMALALHMIQGMKKL